MYGDYTVERKKINVILRRTVRTINKKKKKRILRFVVYFLSLHYIMELFDLL